MKKIIKSLLIAIIAIIPITVFADMGAPEIPSYEAVITSKDGADTYEFEDGKYVKKGHLDEGAKIEVVFEEKSKGKYYLSFNYNGKAGGYVEGTNVAPVKKEVTPTDISWPKSDYVGEFYVFDKDVELKKGPADAYGSYTTIKKGTKGTVLAEYSEAQYIYVSVKGQKGWLNILGRNVLTSDDSIFIVGKGMNTSCGKIADNTIFTSSWRAGIWDALENNGEITLVNVNGCETFISTFKSENVAYIDGRNIRLKGSYYKTLKDVKVYEDRSFNKLSGTLKSGEVLGVFGTTSVTGPANIYVDHNGIKGWVDENDLMENQALDLYYPDAKGYDINEANMAEKELIVYKNSLLKEKEEKEDKKDDKEEEDDVVVSEKDVKKSEERDSRDIIIICLIAALAFTCGALATIAFANKKKDNKKAKDEEEK